jgi:hypothetical protein
MELTSRGLIFTKLISTKLTSVEPIYRMLTCKKQIYKKQTYVGPT